MIKKVGTKLGEEEVGPGYDQDRENQNHFLLDESKHILRKFAGMKQGLDLRLVGPDTLDVGVANEGLPGFVGSLRGLLEFILNAFDQLLFCLLLHKF